MDAEGYAAIADLKAQIEVLNAVAINLTRHHIASQPEEMREPTLDNWSRVLSSLRLRLGSPDPDLEFYAKIVEREIPRHAQQFVAQVRGGKTRSN